MNTLTILVLLILATSISLLFIALLMSNSRLLLVSAVMILGLANNTYVVRLGAVLGGGAPLILMLLVTVCVVIRFRVFRLPIPSSTLGPPFIFLALILALSTLSVFNADDILQSSRSVISLAVVFFTGWFIFGYIYQENPAESRNRAILISNTLGFLCLLNVVLATVFSDTLAMERDVLGQEGYRLQVEGFNATGVGVSASIAIFWLATLFQRNVNRRIIKVLTCIPILFCLYSLIATGARAAIAALFGTWFIVNILSLKRDGGSIRRFLLTLFVSGAVCYLFWTFFSDIFYRRADRSSTFYELFVQSRLDAVGANLHALLEPSAFGRGFGSSSSISGTNLESFFLRVWVELGVVGSSVYIIAFIMITVYVVKADRYFFVMGERGAFLPSAIFLFIWLVSPTSFGFSLPTGTLAIQLAIASGAVFEWHKRRRSL